MTKKQCEDCGACCECESLLAPHEYLATVKEAEWNHVEKGEPPVYF